jgi:hypothetical protein
MDRVVPRWGGGEVLFLAGVDRMDHPQAGSNLEAVLTTSHTKNLLPRPTSFLPPVQLIHFVS